MFCLFDHLLDRPAYAHVGAARRTPPNAISPRARALIEIMRSPWQGPPRQRIYHARTQPCAQQPARCMQIIGERIVCCGWRLCVCAHHNSGRHRSSRTIQIGRMERLSTTAATEPLQGRTSHIAVQTVRSINTHTVTRAVYAYYWIVWVGVLVSVHLNTNCIYIA